MQELLKEIRKELRDCSTPEARAATRKFVPGAVEVLGVRNPILNAMSKKYCAGGFPLAQSLWKDGAFEERMLAAKILREISRNDPDRAVSMVAGFAGDISDWAVCDTLGMQSLKRVSGIRQKEIFDLSGRLLRSANLWERRLSLVLLEVYTKKEELQPEIRKRLKLLEADKEYYVRKAIEWLKRNLAKERQPGKGKK